MVDVSHVHFSFQKRMKERKKQRKEEENPQVNYNKRFKIKVKVEYPSAMNQWVSRQIPQHGLRQKTTVVFGRTRVVVSRKKEQDPEFMLKHRRIMGIEEKHIEKVENKEKN